MWTIQTDPQHLSSKDRKAHLSLSVTQKATVNTSKQAGCGAILGSSGINWEIPSTDTVVFEDPPSVSFGPTHILHPDTCYREASLSINYILYTELCSLKAESILDIFFQQTLNTCCTRHIVKETGNKNKIPSLRTPLMFI